MIPSSMLWSFHYLGRGSSWCHYLWFISVFLSDFQSVLWLLASTIIYCGLYIFALKVCRGWCWCYWLLLSHCLCTTFSTPVVPVFSQDSFIGYAHCFCNASDRFSLLSHRQLSGLHDGLSFLITNICDSNLQLSQKKPRAKERYNNQEMKTEILSFISYSSSALNLKCFQLQKPFGPLTFQYFLNDPAQWLY